MASKDTKKMAPKISAKDQKLIVVVGTVAILVIFGWFLLRPMWATHASLASEAASASEQITQALDADATQELLDTAKTDEDKTKSLLKGYGYTMDAAQADKLTSNMAKRYGFTIFNLEIITPEEGPSLSVYGGEEDAQLKFTGINRVDVSLTLDGSRDKIQNFINKVEREYPGTHIKSFSWIDNADGKSWNLLCDMSIYTRER